ncbi:DUF2799 domain-containing protein [Motilimonas sp. 1_MG-2023]|uniref:DUF2799 domain-containing protein n=1 Tax=Motilimonas TaxID=1914248 RepID=UPI0026E19F3A|nr:DUF2799 domain-containing protein [Motilimonas sp. 1_MG-2023]MDO6524301.1 DUF2799 domain-containing protein [Motilimonas sp. 1_MG-2023]
MRLLITLFTIGLLSACANTEQQNFATENNWYQVGTIDGQQGHLEKSSNDLKKLASSGEINLADYKKGYQEGLDSYCELSNAYILGVTRQYYQGVCEDRPNGWKFRENWISGRHSTAAGVR